MFIITTWNLVTAACSMAVCIQAGKTLMWAWLSVLDTSIPFQDFIESKSGKTILFSLLRIIVVLEHLGTQYYNEPLRQ